MNTLASISIFSILLILCSCTRVATSLSNGPVEENIVSRSLGERIDDKMIQTKSAINLKAEESLKDTHIKAFSFEKTVILIGQVAQTKQLNIAENAVKKLRDVKAVKNLLVVGKPPSTGRRFKDSLLESKIKAKLIANNEYMLSNIKVHVEAGEVYLFGLATKAHANLATNLVKETKGVNTVIQAFSYVN